MLARSLVHELRHAPSTDEVVVLHFFFKDSVMQNNASFALCSILHQLFKKRPDLILPLRDEIEQLKEEALRANMSALWDMFTRSIVKIKAICILDGLDECEWTSAESFIGMMTEFYLSQTPSQNVRFIITSRPYENLLGRFASIPNAFTLRLGDTELADINSEINTVIDHRLKELETRSWNPLLGGAADKLRVRLKASENRTYLWLRLVLEILEKDLDRREESSLGVLDRLPETVNDAYSEQLGRIPPSNQETAHEILCIVVAAGRPLSGAELQAAHNAYVEVKTRGKRLPTTMDDKAFSTWVQNECGFFIQIYGGHVHFGHQTAKEYLLDASAAGSTGPDPARDSLLGKGRIEPTEAHRIMAESCILYLFKANAKLSQVDWTQHVATFMSRPPRILLRPRLLPRKTAASKQVPEMYGLYPFLEYSSGYWAYHHNRCQTISDQSGSVSLSDIKEWLWPRYFALFDKPNIYTFRVAEIAGASSLPIHSSVSTLPNVDRKYWPLSLARPRSDLISPHLLWGVECGHWRMLLQGIKLGEDISVRDTQGRSLLDIACDNDNIPMISFLLWQQQTTCWGLDSLKSALLRSRSPEAAELLIERGAPVAARDDKGNTGLHVAAKRGDVVLMEALLDHGADAAWTNRDGSTALHVIHPGSGEGVDLLVEKGCPFSALDQAGNTALHVLAYSRSSQTESLEAVIGYGADVSSRNSARQTPLHRSRSPAVVDCLVRHGADLLRAVDKDNRTPLDAARFFHGTTGNGTYAALFFATCKDAPNEPFRERLPLFTACGMRDSKLVLKFLQAGADPHLLGPEGFPFLRYYLDTMICELEVMEALLNRGVKPQPQIGDSDIPPYHTLNLVLA